MDQQKLENIRDQLRDETSDLALGLQVVATAMNLRRARKHYRRGNYKRMALFAFSAGESWGIFRRGLRKRVVAQQKKLAGDLLAAPSKRGSRSW
jgi:hypothetical protein